MAAICDGVGLLIREYQCISLISRLIRHIIDWQVNDSSETNEMKQCSLFLVALATLLPDKIIPEIVYLGEQLDNDVNNGTEQRLC